MKEDCNAKWNKVHSRDCKIYNLYKLMHDNEKEIKELRLKKHQLESHTKKLDKM